MGEHLKFFTTFYLTIMASFWLLFIQFTILNAANMENQCFDSDPLGYCADLDSSVTITSLLNEMRYFDMTYQFMPYGMIYNISVINSSATNNNNDDRMSSIYIIGTHKQTTTPQLQWDIATFFMNLFLNLTDDKHIFVEHEYDGINHGLSIYDLVMANNASKYMAYINAMYDAASSPVQDLNAFIDLMDSLLTYSFWYQDSNLYDPIFRWKQ